MNMAPILLTVSLLLVFAISNSISEFVQTPQSVTTTVNSTVHFNCSGNGTSILWRLNSSFSIIASNANNHFNVTDSPGNPRMSTLQILRVPSALNNSIIYCVLDVNGSIATSNGALLLVQGTLEAPGNISAVFINTSLEITWISPHTLLNVPIFGYTLLVTDLVNGHTFSSEFESDVIGISFKWDTGHCHRVQIFATNAVGQGMVATYYASKALSKDDVNFTISATDSLITITVVIQVKFTCPPMIANITLNSTDNSYTESRNITNDSEAVVIVFNGVSPNLYLPVNILLYNSAAGWSSSTTAIANISTFDTWKVEKSQSFTNELCFRCLFIANSQASGCLIHLHGNTTITSPLKVLTSLLVNSDEEGVSEWSCYNDYNQTFWVIVYDIERYSRTSSDPAIILPVNQLTVVSMTTTQVVSMTTSLSIISSPSVSVDTSITSEFIPSATSFVSSTVTTSSFLTTNQYSTPTIAVSTSGTSNLTLLLAVAVTGAVLILCLVSVVVVLVMTVRIQKVKIRVLQTTNIATTINPIYDSASTTHTAIGYKIRAVELEENVVIEPIRGHLYSEVKRDEEWVPNPTYGQTGLVNGQQLLEINGVGLPLETKIYDSPKHQPLEVPDLSPCPAYDQPPLLPTARQPKREKLYY